MAGYTYSAVGNREDLSDIIVNISPEENFLQKTFGRTDVTAMKHDWLTDSIRPAGANRVKEAADFATVAPTPRVRLSNYIQNFMAGYVVSDLQEVVLKAGIKSEIGYQMVKASKEIARDLEFALVNNATAIEGNASDGGQFGGVKYFSGGDAIALAQTGGVFTFANHKLQTGGAVVFYIGSGGTMDANLTANTLYYVNVLTENTFKIYTTPQKAQAGGVDNITPATGGTNVKVTRSNIISANASLGESHLNNMMEMIWKQGGNVSTAVMSGKNKRVVSGFTVSATKNVDMSDKKRTQVVEVWETDFGMINLMAHRQYADDRIDFFEYQHWKLAYLKPFKVEDVPRKGTYTEKVITGSLTLENRSPQASGAIINLA